MGKKTETFRMAICKARLSSLIMVLFILFCVTKYTNYKLLMLSSDTYIQNTGIFADGKFVMFVIKMRFNLHIAVCL